MAIIGQVGRRSFKGKVLSHTIHLILLLGSVTMVYPFMLMFAGSLKGNVDSAGLSVIPEYFHDENILYKKWIETKYNEQLAEYNLCHRQKIYTFKMPNLPTHCSKTRYNDWNAFAERTGDQLNEFHFSFGSAYGVGITPELTRQFVRELKREPDIKGHIENLNEKYLATETEWDTVMLPIFNLIRRKTPGNLNPLSRRALEFGLTQDAAWRNYYSLDAFFSEQVLRPRYGQSIAQLNESIGTSFRHWKEVTLARRMPSGALRDDWLFFVRNRLNLQFIRVDAKALPIYRDFLKRKYKNIALLNERHESNYQHFNDLTFPDVLPRSGVMFADWNEFITSIVNPEHLSIAGTEFLYRDFLKKKYTTLDNLISAHEFGFRKIEDIPLIERLTDENTAYAKDWLEFVKEHAELHWLRPDSAATTEFRTFLAAPYQTGNNVNYEALNEAVGEHYRTLDDIYVPLQKPKNPHMAEQWNAFIRDVCPPSLLVLNAAEAEVAWHDFLGQKYTTVRDANQAHGYIPSDFDQVSLPVEDVDYFNFKRMKRHAIWEFVTRNYIAVLDMMLYNGYAIRNTVIYCALAVLCALIVNPMAAYALSRFKPPSQYKLLLFLMLTMAFPPMVLGIPNFLIVRKLGLLNTYWALVLPGVANGYSIFLLKGFFDSLPRELYESAELDGASEWTMFWRITMATSKPILAVIALQAFQIAYANFMLAFILCQDPKRWTIMVHLYQLQQRSAPGVVFASIVIAAIPTLLVFVFCQNLIMRGIVVPTEK